MSEHLTTETLQAHLDGELEAHLEQCPDCAADLNRLRILYQSIESLPDEPLTRNLVPAVMQAVGQRSEWLPSLAIGELIVAAALTAGLVLWLGGLELNQRMGDAIRTLADQLGTALNSTPDALDGLINQIVRFELGELIGAIPPSLIWIVAAAALALLLIGNGLVLSLGRDNNV